MTAPTDPRRGGLRAARGIALAVTTGALAVAAHAMAGGGTPAGGITVLGLVIVAGVGTILAGRQRGPIPLLGAVAGTQLALHVVLAVLDGAHADHAGPASHGRPSMVFAHAAAAVVTAVLLAKAEAVVFDLAAMGRSLVLAALRALTPSGYHPGVPATTITVAQVHRPCRELRVLLCRAVPLRGPPPVV